MLFRSTLEADIGETFLQALSLIQNSTGHVVVSGMGKSGIIGRKIAATLASTGTPSLFLHPAEAIHGDLGMVRQGDVVLAISNSGDTEEIMRLFADLHDEGRTVVIVTHEPEIAEWCTRVVRLRDGLIESDESVEPRR
mgnify:CR=1 FL=1